MGLGSPPLPVPGSPSCAAPIARPLLCPAAVAAWLSTSSCPTASCTSPTSSRPSASPTARTSAATAPSTPTAPTRYGAVGATGLHRQLGGKLAAGSSVLVGAESWRGAEGHCVRRRGLVGLWQRSVTAGLEELTRAIGLKKERGRQWMQRWHARSKAKHIALGSAAGDQSLPRGKIHPETLNAKPLFWLRNSLEHSQLEPRDVCKEICSPWAPVSPACPGSWLESHGSSPCPFLRGGCCHTVSQVCLQACCGAVCAFP